jgi:hypothetical protein
MSHEANPYDEGMASSEIGNVQERASNIGAKIKEKASQFGSTVSQTADRQRENAAKGLDRAASSLHDGVGSAAKMAHGVADGMESTATYLRNHSFGDMGSDMMGVCKRHPVQAMISAAVIGFLLGRVIRR